MNTFVNAVANQSAHTENGMKARKGSANACVDLFFKIGASRGRDVIPAFTTAYVENPDLACRILLWSRDVREGSGERKIFRDVIENLSITNPDLAKRLVAKAPELGRFDDMLAASGEVRTFAFDQIGKALFEDKNGLCAKWMPRQGKVANELRRHFKMTPKAWRKTLVGLSNVVETQMCAGKWDEINFNHVPSLASSRYKKAFGRHTEKYAEWVESLRKKDGTAKVNAGAVYPYDVIKGLNSYTQYSGDNLDHIVAQWEALPNYVGDANVLPMVDVSGSMACRAGGHQSKSNLTCMDVAVSLGLYLADKNTGKFKDTFLTFSGSPDLVTLCGNVVQKVQQMQRAHWQGNTNLHAAFNKVLDVAVEGNVPQEEMPAYILILSDMQFDYCVRHDDSAIEMIRRKYAEAGYTMPQVVFWNINAYDNVPVKFNEQGTALVSGFSPAIVKGVLKADLGDFTPEAIMLNTVMVDRYSF